MEQSVCEFPHCIPFDLSLLVQSDSHQALGASVLHTVITATMEALKMKLGFPFRDQQPQKSCVCSVGDLD